MNQAVLRGTKFIKYAVKSPSLTISLLAWALRRAQTHMIITEKGSVYEKYVDTLFILPKQKIPILTLKQKLNQMLHCSSSARYIFEVYDRFVRTDLRVTEPNLQNDVYFTLTTYGFRLKANANARNAARVSSQIFTCVGVLCL